MASGPAPAPAKVLVADDSEADRAAARSALNDLGYEVIEAHDGQQALEVYARERPDLVMLDVVMPRLTGLEACRILKAKAAGGYLPVIMVSTRNSVNARVEGLRSGADDYLGKPYDPEELRARVEALLRTRKLVAERGAEAAEGGEAPANDATSERALAAARPAGRSAFRRRMEQEFGRAQRYADPLACLRVELDQYDALLDGHPEQVVDALVGSLRDIIESSVRKIDLIHRTDDRGYILLLPNTHFPGALAVAERIARDARRLRIDDDADTALTLSIGVSFYPNKDTESLQDLLDLVEAALARARSEPGGKICLYQHQGYLYAPEE